MVKTFMIRQILETFERDTTASGMLVKELCEDLRAMRSASHVVLATYNQLEKHDTAENRVALRVAMEMLVDTTIP